MKNRKELFQSIKGCEMIYNAHIDCYDYRSNESKFLEDFKNNCLDLAALNKELSNLISSKDYRDQYMLTVPLDEQEACIDRLNREVGSYCFNIKKYNDWVQIIDNKLSSLSFLKTHQI